MILSSIWPQLREQSQRVRSQIAKLDLELMARYGDRYDRFKQQAREKLDRSQEWYERNLSEAQATGRVPLDERRTRADREVADAGSRAARKETEILQQLKQLWYRLKNNR